MIKRSRDGTAEVPMRGEEEERNNRESYREAVVGCFL